MSDNCKSHQKCPIYNGKLKGKKGMSSIFKRRYCEGDYSNCARYEIATSLGSSYVPKGLLPNQNQKATNIINNNS